MLAQLTGHMAISNMYAVAFSKRKSRRSWWHILCTFGVGEGRGVGKELRGWGLVKRGGGVGKEGEMTTYKNKITHRFAEMMQRSIFQYFQAFHIFFYTCDFNCKTSFSNVQIIVFHLSHFRIDLLQLFCGCHGGI